MYAVSYDVEAPSELEAYEKAYEMLAKEVGSEAADAVAEAFGVHIESLEGEQAPKKRLTTSNRG